jgi:hypothetical protein
VPPGAAALWRGDVRAASDGDVADGMSVTGPDCPYAIVIQPQAVKPVNAVSVIRAPCIARLRD